MYVFALISNHLNNFMNQLFTSGSNYCWMISSTSFWELFNNTDFALWWIMLNYGQPPVTFEDNYYVFVTGIKGECEVSLRYNFHCNSIAITGNFAFSTWALNLVGYDANKKDAEKSVSAQGNATIGRLNNVVAQPEKTISRPALLVNRNKVV